MSTDVDGIEGEGTTTMAAAVAIDAAPPRLVAEADYTGWVFWDDGGRRPGPGEGYFRSPDHLREFCLGRGLTPPERVQGCREVGLALDADELVERACEEQEMHEDAADLVDPGGIDALQRLLDGWLDEHASRVKSWFADDDVQVALDPARWDAARARAAADATLDAADDDDEHPSG